MDGISLFKNGIGILLAEWKNKLVTNERNWVDNSLAESSKVAGSVAVAWLSLALGRQPLDEEVQKLLGELLEDPAAPARARRLLGEMLMSPSRGRRARLAAVFVAGPKICQTPDDRDRLDALVERLLDDDVVTLRQLMGCESGAGFLLEEPHRKAIISGRRRVLPGGVDDRVGDDLPAPSAVSLDNLQALGLIGPSGTLSEDIQLPSGEMADFLPYFITHLGWFAIAKLEHQAIQAGIAAAECDGGSDREERRNGDPEAGGLDR